MSSNITIVLIKSISICILPNGTITGVQQSICGLQSVMISLTCLLTMGGNSMFNAIWGFVMQCISTLWSFIRLLPSMCQWALLIIVVVAVVYLIIGR